MTDIQQAIAVFVSTPWFRHGLAFLLLLVLILMTYRRLGRLQRDYVCLRSTGGHSELAGHLADIAGRIERLEGQVQENRRQWQEARARARGYVQHIGLVRFSAFADVGSDLSFALALLDGEGSGVVINSLYGRSETRIYAKPVVAGRSTYRLTPEEEEAIRRALGSGG